MRTLTTPAAVRALGFCGTCSALLLAAACEQSHADRQRTLERLGDADRQIAGGAVVRDLRSPWDTGGIIYSAPTNLALSPAAATGVPTASSTNGIAVPDTARAHAAGGPAKTAAPAAAKPPATRDTTGGSAAPRPAGKTP